jgi:hypothetical protein
MGGLLSLAVGAKIIIVHLSAKNIGLSRCPISMDALPAPDHRHGIDGGHCFYVASNIFTAFFVFTVRAE